MAQTADSNPFALCNFDPSADCAACPIDGRLFCHFEGRHVWRFMAIILPVFLVNATGLIRKRQWRHLGLWLVGLLIFLQVPENLILCSHCPYYAQHERRTLLCHANAGLLKLWAFNPAPMKALEKIAFLSGVLAIFGYPVMVNAWHAERAAALGGIGALIGWIALMRAYVCTECPNLSCPLNTVPEPVRMAYLRRNRVFARAWGIEAN